MLLSVLAELKEMLPSTVLEVLSPVIDHVFSMVRDMLLVLYFQMVALRIR
jgi:hypothetical protein